MAFGDHVQSTSARVSQPRVASYGATFGTNVVAGNIMVAFVSWDNADAAVETVSGGGTWTEYTPQVLHSTDGQNFSAWYCLNATGGATTVTVAFSGPGGWFSTLVIGEYTGATAGVDGSTSAQGTAATTQSSGAITTTTNGDLIVGGIYDNTNVTPSAGSGFTARATTSGIAGEPTSRLEDRIQATAGSIAADWTTASSVNWSAFIMAFKPTAGGLTASPSDPVGITDSVSAVSSAQPLPLTYVGAGAWDAPAVATATAPAYPAGVAEFDICYATLVVKPDTATVTTPANWTLVGTSGSIAGGTAGAGTGPIKIHVFRRVAPSGGLSGTQSFTIGTTPSSVVSQIVAFRYDATGVTSPTWETETFTQYSRTTTSTAYGGTGAANITLDKSDALLYISAASDDQPTTHYSTGPTFSATGATFTGTTVIGAEGLSGTGNDVSGHNAYSFITSGSGYSTAAPVSTHTASTTETGGSMFVRVSAVGVAQTVLTATPSDPVGITDVAARDMSAVRTQPDAVGITDSVVATLGLFVTINDGVGITDSSSAGQVRLVNINDSVGITDTSVDQTLDSTVTQPDPVGITDAVSNVMSAVRTQPDAVGITDAATPAMAAVRSQADAVGVTDSVTALISTDRLATDAVGITDAVTVLAVSERSQSDAVGVTDALSATIGTVRAQDDPVGISDAAAVVFAGDRTQPDAVGITDSVTVSLGGAVTIGDAVGLTDTLTIVADSGRTSSDPVGISDSVTATLGASAAPADPVGITDVVSLTRSTGQTIPDPVGISDSVQVDFAGTSSRLVSDPVGVTDVVLVQADTTRAFTDPVGISDALLALLLRQAAPTDSVGIADSLALLMAVQRTQPDAVGITDTVFATMGTAVLLTDPESISDTVSVVLINAATGRPARKPGITVRRYAESVRLRNP
jgi:hypothetical protein